VCGVAGIVDVYATTPPDELESLAQAMASRLVQRGPDDGGVWVCADLGVALSHRRLSILDLSDAGHQPMVLPRPGGELAISYNGEIFNHEELRHALSGDTFVGSGDTESLLHAARAWGVEAAIMRCRGMFALGLVDTSARTLTLLRDRLGEKPLYVVQSGRWLAFASDVAAFRAVDGLLGGIEPASLAAYLATGAVPAPLSIYRGVRQLVPGEVLTVSLGTGHVRLPAPGSRTYWRAADHLRPEPVGDLAGTLDRIDAAISDAVRMRLLSDVPLGAFLSGGIDSSLVVAHALEAAGTVRTFTISFAESSTDEAPLARSIAQHLGTEHEEFSVSAEDALTLVPGLASIHTEPHADPSSIPTALLSEHVRRHVTVALSGDGGDELMAGYPRQAAWARWASTRHLVPRPAGKAAALALRPLAALAARRPGGLVTRLDNLAIALGSDSPADAYLAFGGRWKEPFRLLPTIDRGPIMTSPALDALQTCGPLDQLSRAAYIDMVTFLPDLVLVKADRCSMAHSLEVRSPLLDHRVVELALGLDPALKYRDGVGKWALRRLVERRLPAEVVNAPKSGFEPPIGTWLRSSLRPWAGALLDQTDPLDGLIDLAPVRAAWRSHQKGNDQSYRLWTVLMLLAWDDHRRSTAGASASR
jgi:asparagine synthase (glutamine-hydrolysing)